MRNRFGLILLLSTSLLTSCGGSSSAEKGTALTMDNYTDYLTVSARFFGEEGRYVDGTWEYKVVTGEATVKSATSNYDFKNASVDVLINGTYTNIKDGKKNFSEIVHVDLNIGGNGTNSVSIRVSETINWQTVVYTLTGIGFSVKKVQGTIVRP